MRIGYFADGEWAHRAMDKLTRRLDCEIVFVCARYDEPDKWLANRAAHDNIPFFSYPDINDQEVLNNLQQFDCDIFISMSFNQIFKRAAISTPKLGIINCHAGLLPFYRGRNVLNWVLINDEPQFGITVHHVDEGIDTGDIIKQKAFQITDQDDYASLLNRSYVECATLLEQAVEDIILKRASRLVQSEIDPLGMYCSARRPGDEYICWDQPSRVIFNFVRALSTPGPVARCFNNGDEIFIKKAEFVASAPAYIGIPGAVLQCGKDCFLVKTQDTYIRVTDWVSKQKLRVGDRLA